MLILLRCFRYLRTSRHLPSKGLCLSGASCTFGKTVFHMRRLVNQTIDRATYLQRLYVAWKNALTGERHHVPKTMAEDLSCCLTYLAAQIDVPQRCICATAPGSFCVLPYMGQQPPGNYPRNSVYWELHCNICDDVLTSNTETRRTRCSACGILHCHLCEVNQICWLCASEIQGYTPLRRRELLLSEAYDQNRTWAFAQNEYGQAINHYGFDMFPFVKASFVSNYDAHDVWINLMSVYANGRQRFISGQWLCHDSRSLPDAVGRVSFVDVCVAFISNDLLLAAPFATQSY